MNTLAFANAFGTSSLDSSGSEFEAVWSRVTSPRLHPYGDLFVEYDNEFLDRLIGAKAHVRSYYIQNSFLPLGDSSKAGRSLQRRWVSEALAASGMMMTSLVCTAPAAANDHTAQRIISAISSVRPAQSSSIIGQLERLQDGWAGADSIAPSERIITDVSATASVFENVQIEPTIEVDDDGTVALEWLANNEVFCLTFLGDGHVIGTISPRSDDYPGWKVQAEDEISIADYLSDARLRGFVRPA